VLLRLYPWCRLHNPLCGGAGAAGVAFENAVRAPREKVGSNVAKAHTACVPRESINAPQSSGEAGEEKRRSRCSSTRSQRGSEHRAFFDAARESRSSVGERCSKLRRARRARSSTSSWSARTQCWWGVGEARTWLCSTLSVTEQRSSCGCSRSDGARRVSPILWCSSIAMERHHRPKGPGEHSPGQAQRLR
jgi:hypothetical protein